MSPAGIRPSRKNRIFPLFGQVCQYFVSASGDQHIVFDPHAAEARQVNPWLDRNHHARLQLYRLSFGQPRGFVNFQADAVTQPVTKLPAETRLFNHTASHGVDLLASEARLDGRDCTFLRV